MKIQGNTKERIQKFEKYKQETLAIHGGQSPDPITGAVMPPLYQTSTYAQTEPSKPIGEYEYTRSHNPTRRTLEDCVALIEGGTYALATCSGMSATQLVMGLLAPGDEVLCGDDVYGGTYRLLTTVLKKTGLQTKFLNFAELEKNPNYLKENASSKTKLVWLETPTNPLLKLFDIQKISKICKENGWLLCVDNTFMSPIFQRPLSLGADIVVHSMTKYIGGHSDTVAGVVVTSSDQLADQLYRDQNSVGYICSPFDSWLLLRSIKTLPIRMRAHQTNALALAEWLEKNPKIEKTIYPGLKSHPQHALAQEQMSGFGGMISFYLKGDMQDVKKFLSKLKVVTLAESLGGVESLVNHPASMTHASIPVDVRAKLGISDTLIRLSVGLEDLEDIQKDITQALL
ncbi:MAG: PLP-dependent aspartate aminotransferase family protein [Bdellovibrionota bacterium]